MSPFIVAVVIVLAVVILAPMFSPDLRLYLSLVWGGLMGCWITLAFLQAYAAHEQVEPFVSERTLWFIFIGIVVGLIWNIWLAPRCFDLITKGIN